MATTTTKELALERKTFPLVEEAKNMTISDDKDMAKATEILSKLNKAGDALAADKEKLMRPALDTVNEIRSRYKPSETAIKGGVDWLRSIMTKYRTEQKRVADEKAAKLEARVGTGKGKLKASTAIEKMADIEQPDDAIVSDDGAVKFRTVQVFEVIDITKLPAEYLLPNEPAIRKAQAAGIEIPGVKYSTEERPINTRF